MNVLDGETALSRCRLFLADPGAVAEAEAQFLQLAAWVGHQQPLLLNSSKQCIWVGQLKPDSGASDIS